MNAIAEDIRREVLAGCEGSEDDVLLETPLSGTLFTGYTRLYVPSWSRPRAIRAARSSMFGWAATTRACPGRDGVSLSRFFAVLYKSICSHLCKIYQL